MLTQTRIDGADFPRDLYTSYGRTTILDLRVFLMVSDKIGSIAFAAISFSSKHVFVLSHPFFC